MKIAIHTHTSRDDNFLIVAPTYKILQQSTLPAFLKLMDGYGEYSKADAVFKVHGGGTVYFRTATDPDSIVGITNVRAVWGDEAGLFTLYFWENMRARAAFREAPITLTTSPYTLNWLYKEIIRPKSKDPKARPDCELVQAASWENPFMPMSVIEEARLSMDPRRFNALFGGLWERMSGLVYDCFDEDENQCDQVSLPGGSRVVGGIDWGYTEPFVLKIRGITVEGFQFGLDEFYRSGMTIMDIEAIVLKLCQIYNIEVIYCGPDQPASIEHLNRALHKAGLRARCVPADNDVRTGIDRHYELLKTRRLKYVRGKNRYTLDEIDTYHYPEPKDLKPDQNIRDQSPVQQNDHALDADRYISIMTYHGAKRLVPRVPADPSPDKVEDQFKRIERLKRPIRSGGRSEDWS
jgi:PBSX family phage terminase large subunit